MIIILIINRTKSSNIHSKLLNVANIWRRYSEFELIKDYLQSTYPWVVIPPLPEKKASTVYFTEKPFIELLKQIFIVLFLLNVGHRPPILGNLLQRII